MENSEDPCDMLGKGDEHDGNDNIPSTSSSSSHRLFGSHNSVHRMMGGGRAADVMLWRQRHVSFGVIVVATFGWFLFERSGLPFLPICSNVLLLLILLRFIHANYAAIRNRPLKSLPELALSEDMVNSAAASFRAKINYMLLMAHDISRGKDFKLFFKVVFALWLLSVAGSFISFFTLAYIGILIPDHPTSFTLQSAYAFMFTRLFNFCYILSYASWAEISSQIMSYRHNTFHMSLIYCAGVIIFITIPAIYNRYQVRVDKCCGMIQRNISKHYKTVDDNVISRLPRNLSRHKDL